MNFERHKKRETFLVIAGEKKICRSAYDPATPDDYIRSELCIVKQKSKCNVRKTT